MQNNKSASGYGICDKQENCVAHVHAPAYKVLNLQDVRRALQHIQQCWCSYPCLSGNLLYNPSINLPLALLVPKLLYLPQRYININCAKYNTEQVIQ